MASVPTPRESSFYVTGGTLSAADPSYVERHADTELLASLQAGEFCYVLNSRQMGKYSLMVRTVQRLREQGVATAVIDLTAFGQNLTRTQWYFGLLIRLGQELDIEDELEACWDAHERLSPVQRWRQSLQEVVVPRVTSMGTIAPSLVIFIDEIDVVRSLLFCADEFFAFIRHCYGARATGPHLHALAFCLLGVATPSDLVSNPCTSPFNIGTRIEVKDFTSEEARPLEQGLGEHGAALLPHILHWTNGHPYLTQQLCRCAEEAGVSTREEIDALSADRFLSA